MKTAYIVAGEVSGDHHAAGLMRAMLEAEPDLKFLGVGGPEMAAIDGSATRDWLDEAAVLGLVEVLKKYSYFKGEMDRISGDIIAHQPDYLILVDYPGFNLRLAAAVRERFEGKIIQYISPQVWAWKKGRVKTMARLLDLVICLFPFEPKIFDNVGLPAVCCGHPINDRLAERDHVPTRDPNLIGLLPGSRRNELNKLLPPMLEAARGLLTDLPDRHLIFQIASPSEEIAAEARQLVDDAGMTAHCTVRPGAADDIMARAACATIASGTATLEAAALGLPYCLVYKVNWLTYRIGRAIVDLDHIGMANILAGREIVRELLQSDASPTKIRAELLRLLSDKDYRKQVESDLASVQSLLGDGNAYPTTAKTILNLS